jgi:hypothetical protein
MTLAYRASPFMRPIARLVAAVAIVLLAATPLLAASRQMRIVDVAREQLPLALDLAVQSDGSFLVAWRGEREGLTASPVWARLYDVHARPRTSPFPVSGRGGRGVRVVPTLDGAFWVVYARADNAVVARRVSRHGGLEKPIPLLPAARSLLNFRAKGNGVDGGFVVWEHIYDDINHEILRAFGDDGRPLGPVYQSDGGDPSNQLAVAPDGSALLIAEFIGSDGLGSHLYGLSGRLFDRNGALIDAVELTPPPGYREGYWGGDYAVTATSTSHFIVTWLSYHDGDGGYRLGLQEVTASGALLGVRDAGVRPSGAPTAPTPDGGFVLAWNTGELDPYPHHAELVVQRFAASGATTSDPLVVASRHVNGGRRAVLATNLAADLHAAWWANPSSGPSASMLRVAIWRFDGD